MDRNSNQLKSPTPSTDQDEEKIPFNGFQQIVEMLQVADPAFRESLLKRLAARDQSLAASLKRDLAHR
jgi:hypothetical protein